MSVSVAKDIKTGMITLRFQSTGREVQLMPEESLDYDNKMRMIRAEGSLCKDHIGKQALEFLQEIGRDICEGDPNTIAEKWVGNGSKIVQKGIDAEMIYQETTPNPFALFYLGDSPNSERYDEEKFKLALKVSREIKALLDNLFEKIRDSEDFHEIDGFVTDYGLKIRGYRKDNVGVGDTATDEQIWVYLTDKLKEIFDKEDVDTIGDNFYDVIH